MTHEIVAAVERDDIHQGDNIQEPTFRLPGEATLAECVRALTDPPAGRTWAVYQVFGAGRPAQGRPGRYRPV